MIFKNGLAQNSGPVMYSCGHGAQVIAKHLTSIFPFVWGMTRCHCIIGSELAEKMHLPLNSLNIQTKALHARNMPVTVVKLQDVTSQKTSILINITSGTSSLVGKFWTGLAQQLAP